MAGEIRLNPVGSIVKANPLDVQGAMQGLRPDRADRAGMYDEANRDLRLRMYGAQALDAANAGQQGSFVNDQQAAIKGSTDPNSFGTNQLAQAQNPMNQAMALAASTQRTAGGAGIKQAMNQGIEGQQANIAALQPAMFQEQNARLGQAIDFTGQARQQDLAYEAQMRELARNYENLSLDQQKAIMDRETSLASGQMAQQAASYQQNAQNKGAQLGAIGTVGAGAVQGGLFNSSGAAAPQPQTYAGQSNINYGSFTA